VDTVYKRQLEIRADTTYFLPPLMRHSVIADGCG